MDDKNASPKTPTPIPTAMLWGPIHQDLRSPLADWPLRDSANKKNGVSATFTRRGEEEDYG